MPIVRNDHATVVHGRDQRAHVASRRPPISAASAKEKATEKPTYPMYSNGGWNTMPGSCSSGFRSRPSAAGGTRRSNGFDVNSRNNRKPTLIRPITEITRASNGAGRLREKKVTAQLQP